MRHVEAFEEQGAPHVALPRHQPRIGRVGVIKQRADRAIAILLGQGCADPNEVFPAAHKHRGHTGGHLLEVVHFLEIIVQHFAAQMQTRRLRTRDGHRFIRVHAQAGAETLFEQTRQALGTFTQGAVKGAQLIGQQPGLTGQVFFAGGQVGRVQRAQGEQGTAGDDNRQYHGKRKTKL
ncbi:hypothetical protein FQZ97_984740 [compost metagenome]